MRENKSELHQFVTTAIGVLLTGWMIWVSKTLVGIQSDVAVLNFSVLKKTVQGPSLMPKQTIESGMNVFHFLLKEKK